MANGLNFTDHYAPIFSSGATFNSEFAANTGTYSPNGGNAAYSFSRIRSHKACLIYLRMPVILWNRSIIMYLNFIIERSCIRILAMMNMYLSLIYWAVIILQHRLILLLLRMRRFTASWLRVRSSLILYYLFSPSALQYICGYVCLSGWKWTGALGLWYE